MIDVTGENLIPIRDVPGLLPPRPTGRRVHLSVVYRWIGRGIRGVRLEAIRIGGTTYTSAEALQAFAQHLSQADRSPSPSVVLSWLRVQVEFLGLFFRETPGRSEHRFGLESAPPFPPGERS